MMLKNVNSIVGRSASRSTPLTGRPKLAGVVVGRRMAKAALQLVEREQQNEAAAHYVPTNVETIDDNYIKSHKFARKRQQVAAAAAAADSQRQAVVGRQGYESLDLSFEDTKTAYKSKRLGELVRNYMVLGLCSSDLLVRNNDKLMKLTRRLFGKRLFKSIMRSTFYGQFVAGQDEREITPVIKHLASFGVKTILDYSAEEDVSGEPNAKLDARQDHIQQQQQNHQQVGRYQQVEGDFVAPTQQPKYLPVARTYFYQGESQCEKNLEIFFKAIDAVAQTTGNTGFAAIKLTALGRPKLLMKLSSIIDYMRQQAGGSLPAELSLAELLDRFDSMNVAAGGRGVGAGANLPTGQQVESLDEDDREMLANLMRRVERIASYASQVGGARCMVDAEQTYMQPAINMIAMELMRKFNRKESIIFNTYQCYLKGAYNQLVKDLALARREGFYFGAKLVRGAYMDQERDRAKKLGYEDPINHSFEATTAMYEKTLAYLMGEIERELQLDDQVAAANGQPVASRKVSIMVASHNEDTVKFALGQMAARGIKPEHRVICFGQLYGMCDHISFTLGQSGYSVYKYTPYGPIEEVLPYLGRRAIENHGFLSKLQRERGLLSKEILDRIISMRLFYRPVGNYKPS